MLYIERFLRARRVYNFVLYTVIPRNYVLGVSETFQTTQVELYFPINAKGFQGIYLARKKYTFVSMKTFTKYVKLETSYCLKRRRFLLNRGESPTSTYPVFNRTSADVRVPEYGLKK